MPDPAADSGVPFGHAVTRRAFLSTTVPVAAAAAAAFAPPVAGAPPEPDGRLGIAIVGLGQFARYVLPRLAGARRVRVAALVSDSPELARRLAAEHGVPAHRIYPYDRFDALAEADDVGAVYLALPVGLHAPFALRAFAMGKHVLTEKTMAASVDDARAMITAADSARRTLMVAYRARFDPYNREAIRLAREQELGEVVSISAHKGFAIGEAFGKGGWRAQPALAGGGALMDIGIYSVQAARCLAGEEPVEAVAFAGPEAHGLEHDMTWMFRFPSGVTATCSASWRYALQNRYRVACTDGWFELEPATSNGNLRLRVGRGNAGALVEERMLPQVDQIPRMFDHFAECVAGGITPLTSGLEGLRDLEAIRAIHESARTGRAVSLLR